MKRNKSFTHNELFEEYIKNNLSIREISVKYNSTYFSVKHQIEKFGLKKKDYADLTSEPRETFVVPNQTVVSVKDVEIIDVNDVPMVWKAIFQTIQQMYRPDVLKYIKNKNILRITIGNKHYVPEEELKKVKAFLNYETLEYKLITYDNVFEIEISIKQ